MKAKNKHKKKKKMDIKEKSEVRRSAEAVKDSARKVNWRLALKELAIFLVMFGVLEACNANSEKHPVFFYAFYVYYIALILLVAVFIIVNRGFSRDVPTPEQLSDAMTQGEKEEYINKLKKAHENGKRILVILIPLLFTVLFDFVLILLPI